MSAVLRAKGISKRYRIGASRQSGSLREAITRAVRRGLGLEQKAAAGESGRNEVWALKDVCFEVRQGEALGIIGRNGAGKSTLLKVLSRITPPTAGEIEIFGSIASLLEVGTGFHPELTGRENIFLNGSILGMPRSLIRQRFDEIVAFAEIERFLDTPVKFYSSGMYVRLAFAVAAHLESEILLLDEVLAVGDIGFQKKCLAKMDDVAGNGRTVVFVSHSMSAIRQLCARTILIDEGGVVADGPTAETIRMFGERLRNHKLDAETHLKERLEGHSGAVRFTHFHMEDFQGNERYEFKEGEPLRVKVDYQVFQDVRDLCLYFALTSESTGEAVTSVKYVLSKEGLKQGFRGSARIEFPQNRLMPREYHPYVWMGSRDGLPYDRINYFLTSCPPLIVSAAELGPDQLDGYFRMESRLITA